MNKIELMGRVLLFGLLVFGEIALAISIYVAAKIAAILKSPFNKN